MRTEMYWVGTQPDPEDRTKIVVSADDAYLVENLTDWNGDPNRNSRKTTVTDILTGKRVTLMNADCGLSCWCALDFAE